jgi:hypothetical protein
MSNPIGDDPLCMKINKMWWAYIIQLEYNFVASGSVIG